MSGEQQGNAAYHDAHIDAAAEWDEASAVQVQPRPSGVTVFSLRLPTEEFQFLKREADVRGTTMSELTRSALRFYLLPRATASLSATAIHHLQIASLTPAWTGGIAGRSEFHEVSRQVMPEPTAGQP